MLKEFSINSLRYIPYKFGTVLTLSTNSTPAMARKMLPLLAHSDLIKLKSMHRTRALNFIVGRGLLALGLQKLAPNHAPYQLTYNEKGKPQLTDSTWYFNIAHSRNLVIIAFAHRPVGIDLEYIRPRKIDKLVNAYFHPKEIQYLQMLAENEKLLDFYQLWSIKEALVKCKGESIFSMSNLDSLANFKQLSHFSYCQNGAKIHHHKKGNFALAIAIQDSSI